MKQLLILSGKGGTGKTTLASAFIKLAHARAYCDCDVDAPNLHLVMKQSSNGSSRPFYGMPIAYINKTLCTNCNLCIKYCRFNAIISGEKPTVDIFACEGCGLCIVVCPQGAISKAPHISGELQLYKDETIFSTAQLKMGSGNSGLLVTEVKKQIKSESDNTDIAIIDGSPGIGCPVIASLSGVQMVLIVAEPTLSGISDLERIIKTAKQLNVRILVCINKYDINIKNTKTIEVLCKNYDILYPQRIPFDNSVVGILNDGLTIVDVDCIAGEAMKKVYNQVMVELDSL